MISKKNELIVASLIVSLMFGLSSVFVRQLDAANFSSMQISFMRYSFSTVILLIIILLMNRSDLKIHKKDLPLFIVFGLINIISNVANYYAIASIPVGFATVLQMTAPFYVMVLSYFLFKENITVAKIVAVVLGIMGCSAVGGLLQPDFGDTDMTGIVAGIISGFAYAFVLMGGKIFSKRGYKPQTSLLYMFLFASLIAIPLCNFPAMVQNMIKPDVYWIVSALCNAAIITVIPYLVLYKAQEYVEASIVSVISTTEVVGAIIVGAIVFGETIEYHHIIGIVTIFVSIILMNFGFSIFRKRKIRKNDDNGQENNTES